MQSRTIALYARVSGRSQDTKSQEPDLTHWAENLPTGQKGPIVWFRDKFTGRTMDRPGFSRMMAAVEAGQVGTIVVWRLDRLGRTAKGLTALFQDLRDRKVNLVSLRDGLNLRTPAGMLMANVLASVAAYETEIRRERVLAGQAVARERGVRFGRPVGPGKRTKVTSEQEAMIVRLAGEGEKKARIARATGLSRPTIYAVLESHAASIGK
jgi:DNA invertase Pin-like site-specific DNA recombinase